MQIWFFLEQLGLIQESACPCTSISLKISQALQVRLAGGVVVCVRPEESCPHRAPLEQALTLHVVLKGVGAIWEQKVGHLLCQVKIRRC